MELAPPRSLIDASGQLTSIVHQQVPQRINYGGNGQAFFPAAPQAMNGPFKFFVQTPAHFLPDPNSPVATQGLYQSMGVQASMGSPLVYSSMPQASAPFGSMVMTDQGTQAAMPMPGAAASQAQGSPVVYGSMPQAVQLPAPARVGTVHSAFSDVSPVVPSPLNPGLPPEGQGTPLQSGGAIFTSGSPVMSGPPVQPPAGWVQGPVLSMPNGTPISASGGVPAALMSGASGASQMLPMAGPGGSQVYPVAAGSPNRFGMAGTPVQAAGQRAETELTLQDLDGTATTGTTFSKSGKKPKKAKKRGSRCMCF